MEKMEDIYVIYQEETDTLQDATFDDVDDAEESVEDLIDNDSIDIDDGQVLICKLVPVRAGKTLVKFEKCQ